MRSITGNLPNYLKMRISQDQILESEGFYIESFTNLYETIAQLSYINNDYLLFFRGQKEDYKNKASKSTLYPSIYRGQLDKAEIKYRFNLLKGAEKELIKTCQEENINELKEIKNKKYIRWSLLQHYDVVDTPLLDFSQSLRVACSFAQLNAKNDRVYIYVVGLPFITNSISLNYEHDLINLRLLSVAPPSALRPYFQEGFLCGTDEVTYNYDNKAELDFNRRIIAKFSIPNHNRFWDNDFTSIPERCLYPKEDFMKNICTKVKDNFTIPVTDNDIMNFLRGWKNFESKLINKAKEYDPKNNTISKSIKCITNKNNSFEQHYKKIDEIRKFRNKLIHSNLSNIDITLINSYINILKDISI